MREVNRLTQDQVDTLLKAPDGRRHADGAGLYLDLRPNKAGVFNASWLYRFTMPGDKWPRDWDQGSARVVKLAAVRRRVAGYNAARAAGLNPKTQDAIALVKSKADEAAQEARLTFKQAYEKTEANILAGLKNEKGRNEFKNRIAEHCGPLMGEYLDSITPDAVAEIVRPFWNRPMGDNLRRDIEKVFTRTGGHNPAAKALVMGKLWKPKLAETKHRKAMEFATAPALVKKLRALDGSEARAAEFLILTGTRVEEVCGAVWGEFDFTRNLWTLTGARTKTNRTHVVPLCDRAAEIIREMQNGAQAEHVFTAPRGGKLYPKRITELLRELGCDCDNHGFRTTLRTWVAVTFPLIPFHVQEMVIAHRLKGSSKHYLHDKPEDRRHIMRDWNGYLSA